MSNKNTLDFDTILIKRFLRDEYKYLSIGSTLEAIIDIDKKIISRIKNISDNEGFKIIELECGIKIRFV